MGNLVNSKLIHLFFVNRSITVYVERVECMRIAIQALGSSLLLQIVYIGSGMVIGWIHTKRNALQFSPGDIVLQSEVAFGFIISPVFLLISYIGIAVILAVFLVFRKLMKQRTWSQ